MRWTRSNGPARREETAVPVKGCWSANLRHIAGQLAIVLPLSVAARSRPLNTPEFREQRSSAELLANARQKPMGSQSHLPRVPAIGGAACRRWHVLPHAHPLFSRIMVATGRLTLPHLLRSGGRLAMRGPSWPTFKPKWRSHFCWLEKTLIKVCVLI